MRPEVDARSHRRRRWRRVAAVAVIVASLGISACGEVTTVEVGSVQGPSIGLSGVLAGDVPDAVWTAADPVGENVALYEAPGTPLEDDQGEPVVLTNPTFEHVPLAFRVLQRDDQWVQVQYPDRPNGTTAWVRSSEVRTRPVEYRIEVRRSEAKVEVFHGAEQVASYPAAMGAEWSPTPLGHFYVDVRVLLASTGGPYGAGQISVTGFSEVYDTFGAGRGQIAIHGTNQPDLIGTPVSAGCIRISNDDLLALIDMVPTGTPVDIVE